MSSGGRREKIYRWAARLMIEGIMGLLWGTGWAALPHRVGNSSVGVVCTARMASNMMCESVSDQPSPSPQFTLHYIIANVTVWIDFRQMNSRFTSETLENRWSVLPNGSDDWWGIEGSAIKDLYVHSKVKLTGIVWHQLLLQLQFLCVDLFNSNSINHTRTI